MKHLKLFEVFSEIDPYGEEQWTDPTINEEEFDGKREEFINKLDEFAREYNKFITIVSPSNWRTTGHHLTELRKMKDDIKNFKPLTNKDLENDWVRNQLY
jgi:hypothetical protein